MGRQGSLRTGIVALAALAALADLATGTSRVRAAGTEDCKPNCVVLIEGFDCPELRTVFCRPSCKGVTIQMCGRVLRKHPNPPSQQVAVKRLRLRKGPARGPAEERRLRQVLQRQKPEAAERPSDHRWRRFPPRRSTCPSSRW